MNHIFPRIAFAVALAISVSGTAQDVAKPAPSPEQPERTIAEEIAVLEKGRTSARQRSLARLGTHPDPAADGILRKQFDRYRTGELPPALWLDLFQAMAKRNNAELKALLAERDAKLAKSPDPLRRFEECLEGGNGEEGRAIFTKKPEAGCIRCHTVDGKGGQIGPDLTWLRKATERSHILESIILPNSNIALGFESAALTLKNGETVAGIPRDADSERLDLTSFADGSKRKLKLADIEARMPLPSPMPPHFGQALGRRAIRDLVEFLAAGD